MSKLFSLIIIVSTFLMTGCSTIAALSQLADLVIPEDYETGDDTTGENEAFYDDYDVAFNPRTDYQCPIQNQVLVSSAQLEGDLAVDTDLIHNDRAITIVATLENIDQANQTLETFKTVLANQQHHLFLFGQSVLVTLIDRAGIEPLRDVVELAKGQFLMVDAWNERYLNIAVSATAPSLNVATAIYEETQTYFNDPGYAQLRSPWMEVEISPTQKAIEANARYTYHKLTEYTEADFASYQPQANFWQYILAGIFRNPDRLIKLQREMAIEHYNAQKRKAETLLASGDPRIDPVTVDLFLAVNVAQTNQIAQLEQALREVDDDSSHSPNTQAIDEVQELYGQLGQRMGAVERVAGFSNPEALQLYAQGWVDRQGRTLRFDGLFFQYIQIGLPAFTNYLCEHGFEEIQYNIGDADVYY